MLLGQSLQLVSGFSLELPVGLLLFAVLSSLMDFDEEYEEETEGVVGSTRRTQVARRPRGRRS